MFWVGSQGGIIFLKIYLRKTYASAFCLFYFFWDKNHMCSPHFKEDFSYFALPVKGAQTFWGSGLAVCFVFKKIWFFVLCKHSLSIFPKSDRIGPGTTFFLSCCFRFQSRYNFGGGRFIFPQTVFSLSLNTAPPPIPTYTSPCSPEKKTRQGGIFIYLSKNPKDFLLIMFQ